MCVATIMLLCSVSVFTDIKYRIIPNKLTFPLMAFGVIYHGLISGLPGVQHSLAGLLTGLGILLLPFLMGGMGAGDVKFVMAAGALGGSLFVFKLAVFASIAGAVMAVIILAQKGLLWKTIKNMFSYTWCFVSTGGKVRLKIISDTITMPYAVCLATGAIAALFFNF